MNLKLVSPMLAAFGALPLAYLGYAHANTFSKPFAAAQTAPKGPYTWRNAAIVAGGFIDGFVFHPRQKNLLYTRTDIGGAYRWDAARHVWIPLSDFIGSDDGNLLGVESLAIDPSDPNRLYMAGGMYTNDWGGNGAIFCSNDQGRTFTKTSMPFKMGANEPGRSIGERLAVDPNKGEIVFFGSRHDGLWQSKNRGAAWAKVATFPTLPNENRMGIVGVGWVLFDGTGGRRGQATQTIYAGTGNPSAPSLFRSTDGGATWAPLPKQPFGNGLISHHGVLTPDGKTLYATYGNGPGPNDVTAGAVWKCDLRTGTWTDVTPEKGAFGYAGLALDAQKPNTIMVTTLDRWSVGDTIFRSTDSGTHWYDVKPKSVRDASPSPYLSFGRDHVDMGHWMGALALNPFDSNHAVYGTGATIWAALDLTNADKDKPTQWTVQADGLEETAVLDLVSPPSGPPLLSALGDIGGFRHDDLNVSPRAGMYRNPMITTTNSVDFAELAPSVIARVGRASGQTIGGATSLDGGTTWTPFASQPAGSRGGGTIALSADGETFLWLPEGVTTPFVSQDKGKAWTACTGLPARTVSIAANRTASGGFWAFDATDGKLYESRDGKSFSVRASGGPVTGRGVRLEAVPGQDSELWLSARDKGLWRWSKAGTFTQSASVAFADVLGTGKAAPGKTYPALYLVGRSNTVAGVFRSDDMGATWVRVNDDTHQYGWIGQAISGDPRVYGRVYLGTNGRGILVGEPAK